MTEQWVEQLKAGDDQPFQQWSSRQYPKLVLLAIQLGLPMNEAETMAIDILLHIRQMAQEERVGDFDIYQIAFEKMASKPIVVENITDTLVFPEDEQIHNAIIQLPFEQKLYLALLNFHELSLTQTASIVGQQESIIQATVQRAIEHLALQKPTVALSLLQKSYNRLAAKWVAPEIKDEVLENLIGLEKFEPRFSFKQWLLIGGSIVSLLTIFFVMYFSSDAYALKASEKLIDEMEAEFEAEVQRKYTLVGLKEEKVRDYGYPEGIFNELTRQEFKYFIRNLRKQVENEQPIERKEVKKQFEDFLDDLYVPSDMVEALFKNPLTVDVVQSEQFINEYYRKMRTLQQIYFNELYEHYEIFDSRQTTEQFYEKKSTYPEEVQTILSNMGSQNLTVELIEDSMPIIVYKDNEYVEKVQAALHENSRPYVQFIGQITLYTFGYLGEPQKTLDEILYYENILLETERRNEAFFDMLHFNSTLIMHLIASTEYDYDNRVISEHRKIWERLAKLHDQSPTAVVLQPLIEDMERNGWKKSKIVEMDSYYFFPYQEAIDAAINGSLKQYAENMSDWTAVSTASEVSAEITAYNDSDFQQSVQQLYREVHDNHNWTVLKHESPLLIIGLFHYANEQEDAELVWQLIDESNRPQEALFFSNYTPSDYHVDNIQSVEVAQGDHRLNNSRLAPIIYTVDKEQHYGAWLIWNEEEEMWFVESYDFKFQ